MKYAATLITSVKSIEENEDEYIVEVEVQEGLMMARSVTVIRARARAMIAAGVVEGIGNKTEEIANAVRELDFWKISRFTEVISGRDKGEIITVEVKK